MPSPIPAPAPDEAREVAADAIWNAYRQTLWRRIAARRPAGIRMAGEALVRFTLDTGGTLISVELERSSGNAMLDRLALRTVRSASPFLPSPEAVKEQGLTFPSDSALDSGLCRIAPCPETHSNASPIAKSSGARGSVDSRSETARIAAVEIGRRGSGSQERERRSRRMLRDW
jgi:TonB family protein